MRGSYAPVTLLDVPTQRGPLGDAASYADACAFVRSLVSGGTPTMGARVALATRSGAGWREATYDDLDAMSQAAAHCLRRAGVRPGARVLLRADASPEWVAVLLGVWLAGAIAVPVDPKATDAELRGIIDRCGPHLVVSDPAEIVGNAGTGEEKAPAVARAMSDPALIVWTSGTTGTPKGVTLTFGSIAYDVSCAVLVQRLTPADRWLSVLPLHHMLELSCALLSALASGAELSFAQTLIPAEIVGLMAQRRTTHLMTVPLLLRLLRPALARAGVVPQVLFVGGAPVPPGTIESYAGLGVPVYQGYGLTETSPLVTANAPDVDRPGSVGRALPGTEIRVDSTGQLQVRSPAVMAGYWDDEALTRTVLRDGWFATGDLGFVDDDGFVHVTGRAKNLIVLESGKNVQPEEVEIALHASPLFAEVCVVGVPSRRDPRSGSEEVCAVVVPTSPVSQDDASAEVARVCAALSGYKRPTVVAVCTAELPKSAKRAIVRRAVAQLAVDLLASR